MAQQVQANIENTFVNGLITQATGLNFPEKACTDTDNCIFWETGEVSRRKGIDFEDESSPTVLDRTDCAMSTFVWKNVSNDANITLVVEQVGDKLYFWDGISFPNISLGVIANTIDLTTFIPIGGSDPSQKECQFANGHGFLFVTHPSLDPFYVSYDPSTNTVTGTVIELQIRDFAGDPDETAPLGVDFRPVTNFLGLSNKHHYNLRNQGWNDTNIQTWDTARVDMPSNADVMFLFKNSSEVFDPATTAANIIQGNSPAPKGHFILNVFDQDRVTASSISGLTETTTSGRRTSTCAFFAGRVFYSGINFQTFKGYILFSQIIEPSNTTQFGQCYQANDPTSEQDFDLLPSDGGVIDIAEAGQIYKLFPTQSSLIVFAANGVWQITGSTGLGFTASDYSVNKLSDTQSISGTSFVNVGGMPIWWNHDGIYTIASAGAGILAVKNLTEGSIKFFYQQSIPDESKLYARGAYDSILKRVQWVYKDDSVPEDIASFYNFNRMLTLNLNTNAYYPWSIASGNPTINGIFFIESVPETITEETVIDGASDTVIDALGDTVTVLVKTGLITSRIVYVTTYPQTGTNSNLTFSVEDDITYQDWMSYSGGPVDYSSFFVTGYKLHGNAIAKFQPNWVYVYHRQDGHLDGLTSGSYKFRGVWDYANNTSTNRFSIQQTVSYTDPTYTYGRKRLKVRGHGLALQFRVDSNGHDPFDIIGWGLFETKNQLP